MSIPYWSARIEESEGNDTSVDVEYTLGSFEETLLEAGTTTDIITATCSTSSYSIKCCLYVTTTSNTVTAGVKFSGKFYANNTYLLIARCNIKCLAL